MTYKACLFDADGTILDTAELIKKCFHNTLHHFGAEPQSDEIIMSHVGLPFLQQAEYYLGPLSDKKKQEVWDYHRSYQLKIHSDFLKEGPDTKEALTMLHKKGIKLGIVTSRNHCTLDIYLKTLELDSFFETIITPEDVSNPKPHGEPSLKAAHELNLIPEDCLFIGDAIYDQQSAIDAGMHFVYVNWSHIPYDRFQPKPEYRINSVKDLLSIIH